MDELFSSEMQELVFKARKTAIDLGYDYISTIHFFIADCENKKSSSIFRFGFEDENEFEIFKTDYTLHDEDTLDLLEEDIPLTKEAEKTIQMTDIERMLCKQTMAYPCHFFLACLKNENSLLFECFKDDENAIDSLTKYYDELGEFQKDKMLPEQIAREYYLPDQNDKTDFINKILKFFRRQK